MDASIIQQLVCPRHSLSCSNSLVQTDKIERTNQHQKPNRKRPLRNSAMPSTKKKHGSKVDSLKLDKEKLLNEARQWPENKKHKLVGQSNCMSTA